MEHGSRASVKEAQKKVFMEQIEIALEVGKPLMIHARPSKAPTMPMN